MKHERSLDQRIARRISSNVAAAIISPPVSRYITSQRHQLFLRSQPLSASAKEGVQGYFGDIDLAHVRIVVADPLPIADPPFTVCVRRLGFDFPTVALAEAITFDNVIACREPMRRSSLLFHELVHVAQYRLLGVDAFAKHYVNGFLVGGSYHEIPLECCAFELEGRFVTGEGVFDVATEVAAWLAEKRF